MIAPGSLAAEIEPTQCVVFYPTFGRRAAGGWEIALHAGLFREGVEDFRKKFFLGLLRRVLKIKRDDLHNELFRQRIAGFLLREQPGRHLAIQCGERELVLPKRTRRNGHVRLRIQLSDAEVERMTGQPSLRSQWLALKAATAAGDPRTFDGAVRLILPTGVSVISDIDDTLKHTGVGDRKVLLANTFLHKFEPIDGMADVFRRWAADGAAFHYVSSSPWQLYWPLRQLLDAESYPAGTFHLKTIRFRDPSVLRLFVARRLAKRRSIVSILKAFPYRRFVLVGDSGEKDPEMYGDMARRFPRQIARIFIRDLPHRPVGIERSERAFRRLPEGLWHVYRDAAELDGPLESMVTSR
jgi:hypothetical protein